MNENIQPRLIRLKDVPRYLGMDRNRFNSEVRPVLTEIPIGSQGIAFDRYELDCWVDEYKGQHGRSHSKTVDPLPATASRVDAVTKSKKSAALTEFAGAVSQVKSNSQ